MWLNNNNKVTCITAEEDEELDMLMQSKCMCAHPEM